MEINRALWRREIDKKSRLDRGFAFREAQFVNAKRAEELESVKKKIEGYFLKKYVIVKRLLHFS